MTQGIIQIYKGKAKPDLIFIGVKTQPIDFKDEFGDIGRGNIRACWINTKWGQLQVPKKYMGKNIKIIVGIGETQ